MKRPRRDAVRRAWCIGSPRPAQPVNVWAEDLSLVVRRPLRLRLVRGLRLVLH